MKTRLALLVLVSGALFLGACASDTKTKSTTTTTTTKTKGSMGVMNSKCPMKGEAIDSDDPTTDYHGQKVAFCCKGCLAKFNKLTDAEKDAKLANAK